MAKKQLCGTCLLSAENPENGLCVNGHDNWIERKDVYLLTNFYRNEFLGKTKRDPNRDSDPHIVPMFTNLANRLYISKTELLDKLILKPGYIFSLPILF